MPQFHIAFNYSKLLDGIYLAGELYALVTSKPEFFSPQPAKSMVSMENILSRAEILFAEGKIEESEKCFINLLETNPNHPELLNNLGVISHVKGDLAEAEEYLLRASAANGDYPEAMLNLADLYQGANRLEEASLQLEKYLCSDNNPNIYNRLGKIYFEMDNFEKAEITLKKSIKLNPEQKDVIESLNRLTKEDPESTQPSASYGHFPPKISSINDYANIYSQPLTSWDFKKFKHQPYPATIDSNFFYQNTNRMPLIIKTA